MCHHSSSYLRGPIFKNEGTSMFDLNEFKSKFGDISDERPNLFEVSFFTSDIPSDILDKYRFLCYRCSIQNYVYGDTKIDLSFYDNESHDLDELRNCPYLKIEVKNFHTDGTWAQTQNYDLKLQVVEDVFDWSDTGILTTKFSYISR